jgi:hypothetical protein
MHSHLGDQTGEVGPIKAVVVSDAVNELTFATYYRQGTQALEQISAKVKAPETEQTYCTLGRQGYRSEKLELQKGKCSDPVHTQ